MMAPLGLQAQYSRPESHLIPGLRPTVDNNWEGTADIIDPGRLERIGRLDVIPDREERLAEIQADPAAYGYFLGIRQLVGEGHDQFVDDMFTSPDGRFVYVSRPSFADVVGIELATGKIAWRVKVDGYPADHMAISPDGSRLVVSAPTAKLVDVIDPRMGQLVGRFPSGDQPHENTWARSRTGRPTAPTGATASCRSAVTTAYR